MKNKRIQSIVSAVLITSGFVACVSHRDVRNGLRDEAVYLEKAELTQDTWLFKVTAVKASSPNVVGDYVWPGLESDLKLVNFRFREEKIQLLDARSLQADDPNNQNDDLATSTERVMLEFPGQHVDVKLRESLNGERTNFLEENTEEGWQVRQKFKADVEKGSRDPISSVAWYYEDFLKDCARTTSTNLVPNTFEKEDGYMSWVVEVNYQLNVSTQYGGCWSMVSLAHNVGTATIQYRLSFMQRDVGTYQAEVIEEKDPVNKKYGSFQVLNTYRDPETGILSAKSLLHRWDPNRVEPVVYYFHQGFPERFKPMWQEIMSETNEVLRDSGASLRMTVREWNHGDKERHLGDLRYSFIVWHHDIDSTMGLLGYGPSVSDPRTGEIINANVHLYNIGMDYYRFMIQDYLEEYAQAGKPDTEKKWEEIVCDEGARMPMAPQAKHLQSTLFGEMRRMMDLTAPEPDSAGRIDTKDGFIPTPARENFGNDYHRILNEYRYVNPRWNDYVYHTAGNRMPLSGMKERVQTEREFQDAMQEILFNNNPFGPGEVYTPGGIERQNMFMDDFRHWRKNSEMLAADRDMLLATKNIRLFDDGDAISAISSGARKCANGYWESNEAYSERVIEHVVYDVAIHELGHTLSLRHNFYGSVDMKHMRSGDKSGPAEVTSSVMDYVKPNENMGHHRKWGLYDEAALKWIYGSDVKRAELMKEDFLFCTDQHRSNSPLCSAHDLGITPSQITLNAIERYDWLYKLRNRRSYRKFWDTSRYIYSVYRSIFPLQRLWYLSLYDWGGGGVQDVLKRIDQVDPERTVLPDQEYDAISQDFYNDAIAANSLMLSFYDAIINQPASFRNYQTEFDPYYGDVLRLGIIIDKLFATFAFMDFNEVWNYDPNVYDYVAMFDVPFGTRNRAISQRVLDNMLGANYDTFTWFKYYALGIFSSVTNSNMVGQSDLKNRIAIRRFESRDDFEAIYGEQALREATRADNPIRAFMFEGEEYVYTYLADRNYHLVANKSKSPVSYQYIRDYNEALYARADDDLDNYGLKILLAYYEYYNNFVGF